MCPQSRWLAWLIQNLNSPEPQNDDERCTTLMSEALANSYSSRALNVLLFDSLNA
jgi:hypothetical protein